MLMRKSGVAIAAALLTSGVAATGASAAGATQVSCSNGVVSIVGAPSTTNVIVVSGGSGTYTIQDLGSGATLAYTVGGCLTGITNYTSKKGTITVSGTISTVKVESGDLSDIVNTEDLVGKASIFGGDGNDIIVAGDGNDTINGGTGDDDIEGGYGNDVITGWTGVDTIDAGHGDDTIYESDGYADKIDGGAGNDSAVVDTEQYIYNVETITF